MRAIASMSFDESIAYTESQIALLAMTEDAKEGLKAFGEKAQAVMDRQVATLGRHCANGPEREVALAPYGFRH